MTICTLLLMGVPCFSTNAATLFTNEASFLASTGSLTLESFESLPSTNGIPGDSSLIQSGPLTITNSAGTDDFDVWGNEPFEYLHPTDGAKCVVWYANVPSTSFTFTFNTAINAFGVNIVGWAYHLSDPTPLSFSTNSGENGIAAFRVVAPPYEQFFGIVGSPFTAITFSRPHQNIAATVDEIYFGTAVPEPNASLLAGTMALSLAALRRRK
jgi:hypothetical protein